MKKGASGPPLQRRRRNRPLPMRLRSSRDGSFPILEDSPTTMSRQSYRNGLQEWNDSDIERVRTRRCDDTGSFSRQFQKLWCISPGLMMCSKSKASRRNISSYNGVHVNDIGFENGFFSSDDASDGMESLRKNELSSKSAHTGVTKLAIGTTVSQEISEYTSFDNNLFQGSNNGASHDSSPFPLSVSIEKTLRKGKDCDESSTFGANAELFGTEDGVESLEKSKGERTASTSVSSLSRRRCSSLDNDRILDVCVRLLDKSPLCNSNYFEELNYFENDDPFLFYEDLVVTSSLAGKPSLGLPTATLQQRNSTSDNLTKQGPANFASCSQMSSIPPASTGSDPDAGPFEVECLSSGDIQGIAPIPKIIKFDPSKIEVQSSMDENEIDNPEFSNYTYSPPSSDYDLLHTLGPFTLIDNDEILPPTLYPETPSPSEFLNEQDASNVNTSVEYRCDNAQESDLETNYYNAKKSSLVHDSFSFKEPIVNNSSKQKLQSAASSKHFCRNPLKHRRCHSLPTLSRRLVDDFHNSLTTLKISEQKYQSVVPLRISRQHIFEHRRCHSLPLLFRQIEDGFREGLTTLPVEMHIPSRPVSPNPPMPILLSPPILHWKIILDKGVDIISDLQGNDGIAVIPDPPSIRKLATANCDVASFTESSRGQQNNSKGSTPSIMAKRSAATSSSQILDLMQLFEPENIIQEKPSSPVSISTQTKNINPSKEDHQSPQPSRNAFFDKDLGDVISPLKLSHPIVSSFDNVRNKSKLSPRSNKPFFWRSHPSKG